ncbi:MAG: hypothetical protein ACKO37_04395 [Vampirovibrionales bacterium]
MTAFTPVSSSVNLETQTRKSPLYSSLALPAMSTRASFAGEALLYQSLKSTPQTHSFSASSLPKEETALLQQVSTPVMPPTMAHTSFLPTDAFTPSTPTNAIAHATIQPNVYTGVTSAEATHRDASLPIHALSEHTGQASIPGFQSLPQGYIPILVPSQSLSLLVSALHEHTQSSVQNASSKEAAHLSEDSPSDSEVNHTEEDSVSSSRSDAKHLHQKKASFDEEHEEEEVQETYEKPHAYDKDKTSSQHHSSLKEKIRKLQHSEEPPLRRLRRWIGYALVTTLTTTSALTGFSFGWLNQRFLIPDILEKLPFKRGLSALNGAVVAGGLMFYVGNQVRKLFGLAPSKKRPLYLDDLLY